MPQLVAQELLEVQAVTAESQNHHKSHNETASGILSSQVPQPTYSWKWVGVSIPQKVGNFSLRPSSTAIWPRSRLSGCLLSSYGSWLPQTPTLNFHISPSAAVARHLCPPPNPHFVLLPILISLSLRIHCSSRNEDWEEDMFGLPAQQP